MSKSQSLCVSHSAGQTISVYQKKKKNEKKEIHCIIIIIIIIIPSELFTPALAYCFPLKFELIWHVVRNLLSSLADFNLFQPPLSSFCVYFRAHIL